MTDIANRIIEYFIDPIIYLLIAAGFLVFLWGLVEFMWSLRGGGGVETGRQHMIYGLVGMFIMISSLAIIAVIANTIGVDPKDPTAGSDWPDVVAPGGFFDFGNEFR